MGCCTIAGTLRKFNALATASGIVHLMGPTELNIPSNLSLSWLQSESRPSNIWDEELTKFHDLGMSYYYSA